MALENIDRKSFELGIIDAFSEVVARGVKKLALSSPLEPEMYESLKDDAGEIVRHNGIKSRLEKSLVETDMFAHDIARGKCVIMLYKDDAVLDEYFRIVKEKEGLVERDACVGEERKRIARDFGRLLSYPDNVIERMIAR